MTQENRFKGKNTEVYLKGKAKETYIKINQIIKEDKNDSDYKIIWKSIERTIQKLKENPQYGIQIKKANIPKEYIQKYEVTNLWKCDLANFWRLIYWIDGSGKINIISFIVDIIDHKIYNKKFKYKNK